MKALVSPNDNVSYITSWSINSEGESVPSYGILDNANRIVQLEETEFEVSLPMFWLECNTSVNLLEYYYDTAESVIKLIPNATN